MGMPGFSNSGFSNIGGGQSATAGILPTEAEVTETYASFGLELQQWTPALATMIDREIIEPVVRAIDESDQLCQTMLSQRGWRLTFEAPRLAYLGMGQGAQEVSIFERNLPKPLCDDPVASDLWSKRQQLEVFLIHPSFEPSQRQYVFERLREWRQRGLRNAMRYGWRPSDAMPTDAHILENLVIKMLNFHLDMGNCFLSTRDAPPVSKHLGQYSAAYLRQVTDQNLVPRPAPHYEVVTLQKVWRVRPGNANFLEALALLLHALRRHSPRSYQSFPQILRAVIEVSAGNMERTGDSWAWSGVRALASPLSALASSVQTQAHPMKWF